MSNNPNATLFRQTKLAVHFCLSAHPTDPDLICTRIFEHRGHCCDEVAGHSWDRRGGEVCCTRNRNHCTEKGLPKQ